MTAALEGLVHRARPAATPGAPAGALVLLHGRGTSEDDLFPLLDALDPERRLVGVTPRGPLSLPPGGAHWYALGGIPTPEPRSFGQTLPRLLEWVDALPAALGVPIERTVIGGFSQGAVMSYAVSLGARRPAPAGIVALSGFMPSVPAYPLDLDDRAGLPVAIGHGAQDPVIDVRWGRRARAALEQAGAAVTYREAPIPHAVDPAFVGELRDWLTRTIPGGGR